MHHVNSMATAQYHTRFCIGGQVLSHPHPSEAVHDIVTGGEPLLPIEAQTLQRHLFFVSSLIHDRRIGQALGRNVNLCCVQRHCPQGSIFFTEPSCPRGKRHRPMIWVPEKVASLDCARLRQSRTVQSPTIFAGEVWYSFLTKVDSH